MTKFKNINFYKNSLDNMHCLQACIKSILSFYFPEKTYGDNEIDVKTLYSGGWSWFPPCANWLNELGLNVKLYSIFDYKRFSEEGIGYMKELNNERFELENKNGAFNNIQEIIKSSQQMIKNDLWLKESLPKERLKNELINPGTWAIGKTIHEWLRNADGETSHYVLVINESSPGKWRINDPGLPPVENRKINQEKNGVNVFGDILLIKK